MDHKTVGKRGPGQGFILAGKQLHRMPRFAEFLHAQQGLAFAAAPAPFKIQLQDAHGRLQLHIGDGAEITRHINGQSPQSAHNAYDKR